MSDAALAANISAIGILQPPAVTEKNGELTIAYGARRVRIAIANGSRRSTSSSKMLIATTGIVTLTRWELASG
jgi:hypothetical protein